MRAYFCRVCGHLEWIPDGEKLPDDCQCSLCGASRRAMSPIPGEANDANRLTLEPVDDEVWCLRKSPRFSREWEHVSYAISSNGAVLLFDPPPIFNESAVRAIQALGRVETLILSHTDFVGSAQLWKERLGLRVFMGSDKPLPGNMVEVDQRVTDAVTLSDTLELLPLPGHSPGSIGMRLTRANARPVLFAGDALSVWLHKDGRIQVSVFEPPGKFSPATRATILRGVDHLCCCTGWLSESASALQDLLHCEEPSARPYAGEEGGIWIRR